MIGRSLGHYQLLEKLGEGGMGVVYKARDMHLDRLVAIKVLPPEKVLDPARKARFAQEAKAASALRHPNIVVIHDIASESGMDFIVMECISGKTLDQTIPRAGLRLNEALKIAVQIAGALECAHHAGIVHRDLKPSNVMVDEQGFVKVLDFGLAKLTERIPEDDATATIAVRTDEGSILGTAAYMSPEQAEGKPVDARSDIFSFGSVLYEMLSARRAFEGKTKMSTISAVLRENPEPLKNVPRDVERLVARCLRKDPGRRYQHMADLRVALEDLREESESGQLSPDAVPARRAPIRTRVMLLLTLAFCGVAGALWVWKGHASPDAPNAFREMAFTSDPGFEMFPSFSPDGLTVAYESLPPADDWKADGPAPAVMQKMTGTQSATVLKPGGLFPAWSPDGRWIALAFRKSWFDRSGASLCIVPRIGGAEKKIADLGYVPLEGRFAAWTPDSKWIVVADSEPGRPPYLVLVSIESGEKRRLTTPPPISQGDHSPAVSPDGRTLAFHRRRGSQGDIYLVTLDAAYRPQGEPRKLETGLPNSNYPTWTNDGKELVFCSGLWWTSTMWRIRADGVGGPKRLPFGSGAFQPEISRTGNRLVYIKHAWDADIWRVELLPSGRAAGAPQKFISSTQAEYGAAWSPDGKSVAFASGTSAATQLWLCDASGGNRRQIVSMDSHLGMQPHWSPDGQRLAFHADIDGNRDIFVMDLRRGSPRRLAAHPAMDWDPHWTADGKYLRFRSNRSGSAEIWKVGLDGGDPVREANSRQYEQGPDPAFRYFIQSDDGRASIWREAAGGGRAEKLVDNVLESQFAVSRKGIYYVPNGPESNPSLTAIAFYDFASRSSTKIVDLKPHLGIWWGTNPSVSPDGKYLLYARHELESDDLMLVENFR